MKRANLFVSYRKKEKLEIGQWHELQIGHGVPVLGALKTTKL